MKKEIKNVIYNEPSIEILEIEVEQGFAVTGVPGSGDLGGEGGPEW